MRTVPRLILILKQVFNGQREQNSGIGNDYGMVTGATETNWNRYDMATGVQRDSMYDYDMVTGATEQNRNCHDMTDIHEEVTYCSPSTSSGKQKKNRSTSQPQFRSENTPATIEADQILLALQQLANNNNSRISTIILTGSPNYQNH